MKKKYDAIVIGTGQAGPPLATRLAAAGLETAIIEKGMFGGTCVNTGCTPTKTMIASARAAHIARKASEFGVLVNGPVSVDMKKVKQRKDSLVRDFNTGLEQWLKNTENLSVLQGHARFAGPGTVKVKEQLLTADKIFINVGGRAFVPPGFEHTDYLTNESIMEIDEVPQHLIILGGSYIGLEFGQMFCRFGSQVTIIEKADRLLSREDPDVSEEIQRILELEGIRVRLNATCINGVNVENGVLVNVDCDTGSKQVEGTHLLMAVGRTPNTHDLGLENAGIATNERGFIEVDDQLRTTADGVWALGDVNGKGAFTHTAYNDHEIVMANLTEHTLRKVSDRIQAYALYTDPPLARIGLSETQARESGKNVLIAIRHMNRIARAREKGETHGFIKILVDADSELILGATILGIEGDEIIHSLLDIMYAGESYKTIQKAVHIHPTVSELIPTILGELEQTIPG